MKNRRDNSRDAGTHNDAAANVQRCIRYARISNTRRPPERFSSSLVHGAIVPGRIYGIDDSTRVGSFEKCTTTRGGRGYRPLPYLRSRGTFRARNTVSVACFASVTRDSTDSFVTRETRALISSRRSHRISIFPK